MNSAIQQGAPRAHPGRELLVRYREVFRAAWSMRAELAGPRRLASETAFLPAALSLQDTPLHPAPRRLAWTLMVLFFIVVVWASVGQIDIVAVAPGRIVVSGQTKVVQPLERSVVKEILVQDGDRVSAGQPLITLDATTAQADKATADEQLRSALSESRRASGLLAALDGGSIDPAATFGKDLAESWSAAHLAAARTQLQAEWGDIQAQLARLGADLARRQAEAETARATVGKLEAMLPLVQKREQDVKDLVAQGFMAGHAGQDRTRERIEVERDVATQRAKLQEALAGVREGQFARGAYLAEVRSKLHERQAHAELSRGQAQQEQAKVTQRERLTSLKAPVAGTVQQLAVHTAGGVVTEAQALLVVVPDGAEVMAEVTLENKDIGFVQSNQEASIKLETFPFTRYGTVPATVSRVTRDAVQDEKRGAVFVVALRPQKLGVAVDGKTVKLSPGMNLTAEIKTGRRRIIEYLLSPIQRASNESMRER